MWPDYQQAACHPPDIQSHARHPPEIQLPGLTNPCPRPPKGLLEERKLCAHWRMKTREVGSSAGADKISPGIGKARIYSTKAAGWWSSKCHGHGEGWTGWYLRCKILFRLFKRFLQYLQGLWSLSSSSSSVHAKTSEYLKFNIYIYEL